VGWDPILKGLASDSVRFLRLCRMKNTRARVSRTNAMPPTTLPAIMALLESWEDIACTADEVADDEGDNVGSVDIVVVVGKNVLRVIVEYEFVG
jgi:hypothetical protein